MSLGGEACGGWLPRVARDGLYPRPDALKRGSAQPRSRMGEARSLGEILSLLRPPGGLEEFWSHVEVSVSSVMPSLPVRPALSLSLARPAGHLWTANRSDVTSDRDAAGDRSCRGSRRSWSTPRGGSPLTVAPRGASRISFGYGLRDGSFSGDGHTDGVDFEWTRVWESGKRERLWDRYLDPVARAGDRGTQRLDLALPGDAPLGWCCTRARVRGTTTAGTGRTFRPSIPAPGTMTPRRNRPRSVRGPPTAGSCRHGLLSLAPLLVLPLSSPASTGSATSSTSWIRSTAGILEVDGARLCRELRPALQGPLGRRGLAPGVRTR